MPATFSTIFKILSKIKLCDFNMGPPCKQMWTAPHADLDKAFVAWFQELVLSGLIVSVIDFEYQLRLSVGKSHQFSPQNPDSIFNADGMDIFFKLLPNCTLAVRNDPCHDNVQVEYLPPNCTAFFQPLDLDIIQTVKESWQCNLNIFLYKISVHVTGSVLCRGVDTNSTARAKGALHARLPPTPCPCKWTAD
ncbi:unnamed protein product [Notodromas monacha]|uniref:DDE-1 domain-containing protein n=1 Tax=Notodromas monacha TaxID=399045 RepID=A0A7R9BHB9_9CRUS|nr:unnamed protein product [Notodromas monacha]CAG0914446.1 unnamed protein product [Notodromas monacha]